VAWKVNVYFSGETAIMLVLIVSLRLRRRYMIEDMRSKVRSRFGQAVHDLGTLVRLPSVSADPARRSDLEASAAAIASMLGAVGAPPVSIVDDIPGDAVGRHRGLPGAGGAADHAGLDVGVPTLTSSLRGSTACVVEIRCLEENVHSGPVRRSCP
jgi:hypothetical protein